MGSHAAAITWLIAALALPPLIILAYFPEPARRELEEISPELTRGEA